MNRVRGTYGRKRAEPRQARPQNPAVGRWAPQQIPGFCSRTVSGWLTNAWACAADHVIQHRLPRVKQNENTGRERAQPWHPGGEAKMGG